MTQSKLADAYVTDPDFGYAIRKDVQALMNTMVATTGPDIATLAAPDARAMYAQMVLATDLPARPLERVEDLSFSGPRGEIRVRLFDRRAKREAGPAVVFFHGGGFVMGSLDIAAPLCAEIAHEMDLPVISVDYGLAPEHPFPSAPVDCEAAARWVASSPDAFGFDVTALILTGESAGGLLTITTTIALRDNPADVPVVLQAPVVPVLEIWADYPSRKFPGYTFTMGAMPWVEGHYKPDSEDWRAAPLKAGLAGLPPAVIVTAEMDVLRDDGRAYAAALIQAGNQMVTYQEAPGTVHGFYLFRKVCPSSCADIAKYISAMKSALDGETALRKAEAAL